MLFWYGIIGIMETIKDDSIGVIPVFKEDEKNPLFLLIRHNDGGHWAFPKGHQHEGESVEQTAKRELYEETGIKEVILDLEKKFIQKYEYERSGNHFIKTVIYYLGFVYNIETEIPQEFRDEVIEMRWLPYEEALTLLTHDNSKNILREVVAYIKNANY